MALLPLNLNYTEKDFASLRARCFNMIRSVFPKWTDREVANFGNMLVELFCFVGDNLLFYQDNQAKESRLSDAQLRRSVLALAKQLNYVPEGNSAATADVLITLDSVPTEAIQLSAGRIYETASITERVQFQQLFDVTVPAGLDPPQFFVTVENSSDENEVFSASGLPDQLVTLVGVPFLDDSEVITAANGVFTRVDNFLSSTATDRHYTVFVDEDGRASVRFGNGTNGELPEGQIDVFYKTGGGDVGNVDENSITRIIDSITTLSGVRVNATATNPAAASGGFNRESIESIKQQAPPSTKLTDRTVGYDDFSLGALLVPGVARALMVTSDQVVGLPENRGVLYIVPNGGGSPTSVLLDAVVEQVTVTRPKTVTFGISAIGAAYLTVDVGVTAYFAPGFNPRAVVTAINSALTNYFKISNTDGTPNELVKFGLEYGDDMSLPLSDIFCEVEKVSGIRKLGARDVDFLLNGVHGDVPLQYFEFPVLGSVTVTDAATGQVVLPL